MSCCAGRQTKNQVYCMMLWFRIDVRLRWVCHRYLSVGVPIMHALVVTHLCSCVEIGHSSFVPSCTMEDSAGARALP